MTDEIIPRCGAVHPHHPWVSCGQDRWFINPKTKNREKHKGQHGAFATNPGQLIGNKPTQKPATSGGEDVPTLREP